LFDLDDALEGVRLILAGASIDPKGFFPACDLALSIPKLEFLDDVRGIDRTPVLVAGRTSIGFFGVIFFFFLSKDAVLLWHILRGSATGSPKLTFFVTGRVSAIDVAGRTFSELVLRIDVLPLGG